MESASCTKQTITLIDGKVFMMNGVDNIASFDEGYILLDTSSGRVSVEGNDLKIESLSKDDGNILIKGDISGFFRTETTEHKRGFIRKIFG